MSGAAGIPTIHGGEEVNRSQKSSGSKPGRACSSGWNRRSQTTVVRVGPCGQRVKAATWSADRLSMWLG